MEFRVASIPASFGTPGAQASRPCSSSRASRSGCELPRILHLQAMPATELRVASPRVPRRFQSRSSGCPALPSFGCASRCVSQGCPRLLHLPALPAMDLQVAPNLASFSTSGAQAWSCLRSSALPVVPADAFSGLPRFLHLPAVPATVFQVAPNCVLQHIWRCCFGFPLGTSSSSCASQ